MSGAVIEFYISFLVEDEDGIYGDGEANPNNLGKSPIAQGYPLIMAKKRAVDRYLIQKLGLAGKVYSDSEIPPTGILSEEIQEPVQIVEQVTDQEKVQLENKKEATSSTIQRKVTQIKHLKLKKDQKPRLV